VESTVFEMYKEYSACHQHPAGFLVDLLFDPEDGGSTFL
jgi:hypothetical protein